MAFIEYLPNSQIDPKCWVPDEDSIIRIHSVHARVMRSHYNLYMQLMHQPGPLTRLQREMIAVVVSSINRCHY